MTDPAKVFAHRETGSGEAALIRWAWRSAVVVGFTVASLWSVRLAIADYWFRQQSVQGIRRAISFTSGRADYYVRLALIEPEASSQTATEALQRAVALDPFDARPWIELGLRYESQGALRPAEQCLLRAAGEDKQYLPRWTLANYYFRQHAVDNFWFWAREAAQMINGDPIPLFRLCGRMSEDGGLVDRLNIRKPDVQAAYLSYLLSENRLDLIRPASRYLLNGKRASDVPLLLATSDQLLASHNVDGALDIWNCLAADRRIPFGALQPNEGIVLTNGDFRVPPISQGFDWHLPAIDGVSTAIEESGGLRLTFSGRQPENCEPLAQLVPTGDDTDYELKYEYRTFGIAPGTGLGWRITDAKGNRILVDGHNLSELEQTDKVSFTTAPGCRAIRVALVYSRVPGTTRIEGSILLHRVELTRISHTASQVRRKTQP